ncbi:CCR4-NOT transcription complex subunit 6-like isoform X3 [Patella vulgata]|nr:CCR4-NOT transcription complex subunit 6-like isoform X3 [Patella vulgata]
MAIAEPDRSRPTALFTVMCYNVLCDKYCTRQQYGYCPSWALNWEYRKKGIIEEIRIYSADIISLQEVETEQFHNFFLPELKRDGYDGIFEPKSRAKTMTEQEKKHVDGCAIFYKTNKFTLIKEQLIEFNQIAMANAEGSADMLNRVMTKDNIGLTALLETKEVIWEHGKPPENQIRQQIMVATAHIHWDPEYCDVKLIQTMMLMWELRNIIEDTLQQFRPNTATARDINAMPLLLCGDLNSLPDSGVVEYLTHSKVAANHIDFKELGYENCLKKLNPNIRDKESLSHSFRLGRAYNNSEIMPNTNYTYDFKGIIDYIFYSKDHMNLLGMLGAIDDEWFKQNKIIGCPHPHIPSDHFSLFVEFEMPLPRTTNSTRAIAQSKR